MIKSVSFVSLCLIRQVNFQTHLLNLGTLNFGPVHMTLFHLEDADQYLSFFTLIIPNQMTRFMLAVRGVVPPDG